MGMPLALPRTLAALAVLAVTPALFDCSQSSSGASLPSFQDITSAPAAIQTAAKAVVRIATANGLATGSFISATGLLLTNNHVLGTEVCPVEGCYAQITFDYQRGSKLQAPESVFVKPVAVSIGLDMAVVQVYQGPGQSEISTPSFLTIESHDAASLMKTHITLVGHPEGHLKKWSAGEVVDSDGDWIYTSAFLLPGNSGSPLLNDAGNIVGIIHRGPTGEDYFTSNGAVTFSLGTPSSLLQAAMSAPLPPEMISVTAPATVANVVANDLVYLNAHVATVPVASASSSDGGANDGEADAGTPGGSGGGSINVLDALGSACDAALAVTDYATPEALDGAIQPCEDAISWIECRVEETSATTSSGQVCPDAGDISLWQKRYQAINAATIALNDQPSLYEVGFGSQALAASNAAGLSAGASAVQQALGQASVPMDLFVAYYLSAFAITSYEGNQTTSYVTAYKSLPDYALSATYAAGAAVLLANNGLMTGSQALAIVEALYGDSTVDLGTKLYLEDIEYQSGVID